MDSTGWLTQLTTAQAGKEVTVNELMAALSPVALFGRKQSSSGLSWDYFGGRVTIATVPTLLPNGTITLTASNTNYVESTVAGVVSKNTSGFTAGRIALYKIVTGTATVTSYEDHRPWVSLESSALLTALTSTDGLAEGVTNLYFTDARVESALTGIQRYRVGGFYPGAPIASALICSHEFVDSVSFLAAFSGSAGSLRGGVVATAQTDFDIKKNGSSVGTMRFSSSGSTASFIAASPVTFASGDVLDVIAPGTPDATAANITFTLAGIF